MAETLRYYAPSHPALCDLEARIATGAYKAAVSPSRQGPTPAPAVEERRPYYREVTMPANAHMADSSGTPPTAASPGHKVNITMCNSISVAPSTNSRAAKTTLKKQSNSKLAYIVLEDSNRVTFITEFLKAHELGEEYSPGIHNGPAFKLWWNGSGGKAGAITIDNDAKFNMARDAILQKNKGTCQVNVDFDLDTMQGYRIQKKRPHTDLENEEEHVELLYGTKIPRVDGYCEVDQINGRFILQLKQKWPCEKHPGEHGQPGFCYVDVGGNHMGLKHRSLKVWASAMAGGEATKHEPPNCVEFDGFRDGRASRTKACGRTGPHSVPSSSTTPAANNTMTVLLAALVANIVKPAEPPATPKKTSSTAVVLSPIPTPSAHLHTCLADFAAKETIDLTATETWFADAGFTPDIIPKVSIGRLMELTGAEEGQMWALQSFCKKWIERLEDKKFHATSTSN